MASNAHDELTPDERRALDALPRERMPGRLLEERTVHALRERGFIRPHGARRTVLPSNWWITGIAAALALFASGVVAGQWLGTRGAADAFAQIRRDDTMAPAASVQRTGTAYVAALASLIDAADSADAGSVAQAREVALAALWAAASEVVRLAPDDPVAGEILRGFERARQEQADTASGPPVNQVIWF
jgi:hypothetical protein